MNPKVIYEDNHLLVLEKEAGWLVQRDQSKDASMTEWARQYIKVKYKKPGDVFCQSCHRIDRPVGGVVVFARTSKALTRINADFQNHSIQKTYLAVVKDTPNPQEGKLMHWLEKNTEKNRVKAFDKPKKNTKEATLNYTTLASYGHSSLLKVEPLTGRPHQIRVQLKALGTSIKGDVKYGYPKANKDKTIHLHAYKISFKHPVKKEQVSFTSKPDWDEYKDFIDELD